MTCQNLSKFQTVDKNNDENLSIIVENVCFPSFPMMINESYKYLKQLFTTYIVDATNFCFIHNI